MIVDQINKAARRLPTWVVYVGSILPPAWLLYAGITGLLGVDAVKAMEHQIGEWGLQVLIASLLITPARRFLGLNLLKFRRALGLIGFFYVFLHLMIWLGLDIQFRWDEVWKDILKRPYISIGMLGFVVMIPLALTSWNGAVRRMGAAAWRKLHKLAYLAVAAGGIHYVLLVKGWQLEPMLYCAAIAIILASRIRWQGLRPAFV